MSGLQSHYDILVSTQKHNFMLAKHNFMKQKLYQSLIFDLVWWFILTVVTKIEGENV